MDVGGLKDMGSDYIVEASACAGDADVGDEVWFALEALDCCGVCTSLFRGQRAPGIVSSLELGIGIVELTTPGDIAIYHRCSQRCDLLKLQRCNCCTDLAML